MHDVIIMIIKHSKRTATSYPGSFPKKDPGYEATSYPGYYLRSPPGYEVGYEVKRTVDSVDQKFHALLV
jgi:hypothetical protein